MQDATFSRPGAVDLTGAAGTPVPAGAPTGSHVIDVTEATFQTEVINRSARVPVLIDFWADWCGPCKQLSPILERLANSSGGRWVLAKIDADANQQLTGAFGVQGIPAVFAVIKGQPLPLFQGALPEAQVKQYVDEVLRVATANGVSGTVEPVGPAAPEPDLEGAVPGQRVDPALAAAQSALEAGDLGGAQRAYENILADRPGDAVASAGLARVKLLARVRDLDAGTVRKKATDDPTNMAAQCDAADLDVAGGNVEDAFARLIDTVRRTSGDERDLVRKHLLGLFDAVGVSDPRVVKARSALASALF